MIKYIPEDTSVVFSEIPDEIALAINISNCPHRCPGCHSPYLQGDCGEELTHEALDSLINSNKGITCVAFMGEGNDLEGILELGRHTQTRHSLKVAIYCGSNDAPADFWRDFDYIKVGPYIEELGPINHATTNQRLYRRKKAGILPEVVINGLYRYGWEDITNRFWRLDDSMKAKYAAELKKWWDEAKVSSQWDWQFDGFMNIDALGKEATPLVIATLKDDPAKAHLVMILQHWYPNVTICPARKTFSSLRQMWIELFDSGKLNTNTI